MRVLISDYREQMEEDYSPAIAVIREILPDAEVIVESYGTEKFYQELQKAEGWITAFVPVDRELLQQAEHAIAMMLALNHNLSRYAAVIRKEKKWDYKAAPPQRTLDHKTLTVFGLGRIGRETAKLAQGLGMQVMAVDPFVSEKTMAELHIKKAEKEEALRRADVIINHMALTKENYHYFNEEAFRKMEQHPFFLNVGRGGCVQEAALEKALEHGWIAGAGLDVLEEENVDLEKCRLLERENVILTPHSAFYSADSILRLHTISGKNLAWYLCGQYDKISGLIYLPKEK